MRCARRRLQRIFRRRQLPALQIFLQTRLGIDDIGRVGQVSQRFAEQSQNNFTDRTEPTVEQDRAKYGFQRVREKRRPLIAAGPPFAGTHQDLWPQV